jgi:hypothetical protein
MLKLYLLSFLAFLAACSKEHNTNNLDNLADGDCQYKVNGELITIKNIGLAAGEYSGFAKWSQGTSTPYSAYVFTAQKGVHKISFAIVSDSLRLRNYTLPQLLNYDARIDYNGTTSVTNWTGDYLSINITSYSNSLISGNFTAKLSPLPNGGYLDSSQKGTTVITEGLFKNIRCSY